MQLELVPIRTVGLPEIDKRIAAFGPRRYLLVRDWYFQVPHGPECVIPAGHSPGVPYEFAFQTDCTSFPRVSRVIFDPMGVSVGAGVPHDWIYRYRHLITAHGDLWTPSAPVGDGYSPYMPYSERAGGFERAPFSRFQADDLFKRLNLQINDIPELAYSTYTTLRVMGGFAWGQHRAHDGTERNDVHMYMQRVK